MLQKLPTIDRDDLADDMVVGSKGKDGLHKMLSKLEYKPLGGVHGDKGDKRDNLRSRSPAACSNASQLPRRPSG